MALDVNGYNSVFKSFVDCLSQSANAPLNRALGKYGIYASEHAVLDYTLTKDDETGAVTIKYSSPKNLPIKF